MTAASRRYHERAREEIEQSRDKNFRAFPAKAGTHASASPGSSSRCNVVPQQSLSSCCGAMGPGLRRGDEWTSDERFLHKLGKREAGLSVMGPGSSQVYRTAAALEVSFQQRLVNSAPRCRR